MICLVCEEIQMEKARHLIFFNLDQIYDRVVEVAIRNFGAVANRTRSQNHKLVWLVSFEDNFFRMGDLNLNMLSQRKQSFLGKCAKKLHTLKHLNIRFFQVLPFKFLG